MHARTCDNWDANQDFVDSHVVCKGLTFVFPREFNLSFTNLQLFCKIASFAERPLSFLAAQGRIKRGPALLVSHRWTQFWSSQERDGNPTININTFRGATLSASYILCRSTLASLFC